MLQGFSFTEKIIYKVLNINKCFVKVKLKTITAV